MNTLVLWKDSSGEEITFFSILVWIGTTLCYFGYFFWIIHKFVSSPESLRLGVNVKTRERWIRFVMSTSGQEILSIQTIRNSMMESSFLGSICATIGFYVISLASAAYKDGFFIRSVHYLVLSANLFLAFVSFAVTLRNLNHACYVCTLKSIPKDVELMLDSLQDTVDDVSDEEDQQPLSSNHKIDLTNSSVDALRLNLIPLASKLLRHAVLTHYIGLRIFFFAIIVSLSAISDLVLLIGFFVIMLMLYLLDKM